MYRYKLYVIPGSHACRSAMLMLQHKGVAYQRVDILTLLHPLVVRLHGFNAGGQTRSAGGKRTLGLRLGDRLGTVPALTADGHRISTNHGIARFLDEQHPEPLLLPADPEQRAAVEEVERWANDTLQMSARRILGAAVLRDPATFSRSSADGRMGYLLYRSTLARRLIAPRILCEIFATSPAQDPELLSDLSAMLDRIDGWIANNVLGGVQLNVADFMVAPSLALILYRPDVKPMFEGRPALKLVDRLLPEPASRSSASSRNKDLHANTLTRTGESVGDST
ncbi:MAG TPA: glutathione S-transferase family protein [Solirubrobacteraceae bacterium]|nr:glutathione S-transferase family protein [Solirubrobacteraceae bacterium]